MIDLRSDTITQPTAGMKDAMFSAPLGDDVFGEDPTTNDLETEVAALLGKEAAIFVPSGTMANQIALNLHTRHGQTVLTQENSHIFKYEAGGAAALSGLQFDFVSADDWRDTSGLDSRLRGNDVHAADTALVSIENTHNVSGGAVMDVDLIESLGQWCRSKRLPLHCDGARLWNAAIALSKKESDLAASCDSISVCFSKGLGAPIGSALVGSKEFIAAAGKVRKRWGGGMRQVGVIAAAALYAVREHRDRLRIDHHRVNSICAGLRNNERVELRCPIPNTNMFYFRIAGQSGQDLAAAFENRGVRMIHVGGDWLRAVFHLDVSERDCDRLLQVFDSVVGV